MKRVRVSSSITKVLQQPDKTVSFENYNEMDYDCDFFTVFSFQLGTRELFELLSITVDIKRKFNIRKCTLNY